MLGVRHILLSGVPKFGFSSDAIVFLRDADL